MGSLLLKRAMPAALALSSLIAICGTALAATPKLRWSVPATVSAGSSVTGSWAASAVPRGSRLVVEQPEGTAKVWQPIAHLSGHHGHIHLPKLGIGADYRFRLTVVSAHGVVLADRVATVKSFGRVPLPTLAGRLVSQDQTYSGPTYTFPYWTQASGGSLFTVNSSDNHCDSVTVSFVVGDSYAGDWPNETTDSGGITIVQESQPATSASAAFNALDSVTAKLIPGQSWGVSTFGPWSQVNGPAMYVNGYAICDSRMQSISNY